MVQNSFENLDFFTEFNIERKEIVQIFSTLECQIIAFTGSTIAVISPILFDKFYCKYVAVQRHLRDLLLFFNFHFTFHFNFHFIYHSSWISHNSFFLSHFLSSVFPFVRSLFLPLTVYHNFFLTPFLLFVPFFYYPFYMLISSLIHHYFSSFLS